MFPLHCEKGRTMGGGMFFSITLQLWKLPGQLLPHFSLLLISRSLKWCNADESTVHYFTPSSLPLKGHVYVNYERSCKRCQSKAQAQTGMPCFSNTATVGGVGTGKTRRDPIQALLMSIYLLVCKSKDSSLFKIMLKSNILSKYGNLRLEKKEKTRFSFYAFIRHVTNAQSRITALWSRHNLY